jgi:hypothetical protein
MSFCLAGPKFFAGVSSFSLSLPAKKNGFHGGVLFGVRRLIF